MANGVIHLDHVMTKKGEYSCPVCKKAPPKYEGYSRTWKWKTLRGYQNHDCYSQQLERENRDRIQAERHQQEQAEKLAAWIEVCPRKVGDTVFACVNRITKPTHEKRWNRMVRMRYIEERYFSGEEVTIREITLTGYKVRGWDDIRETDIFPTIDEARSVAKQRQADHRDRILNHDNS